MQEKITNTNRYTEYTCYNCQQKGHSYRSCPYKNSKQLAKKIQLIEKNVLDLKETLFNLISEKVNWKQSENKTEKEFKAETEKLKEKLKEIII